MTTTDSRVPGIALSLFALWLSAAAPVLASPDAAIPSPRASEALLLDIVRVGEKLVAVGDYGHILYSETVGQDWQQAEVPTRRMLTAVHFATPERGWAVGHDGLILGTVDGGRRWTILRNGLDDQAAINAGAVTAARSALADAQEALLQADSRASRQAIQASLEEYEYELEIALERVAEPVHAPPLFDVYFTDKLRGVAIGAFNTLLRTEDGGVTWTPLGNALDNPDEYHLNAITGDEAGNLWIAAEGGLLFRSRDGGGQWESLPSPYHGSWFGIVRAPDTGRLVVFGLRGHAYRSDDSGDSWQPINVPTDRTLAGGAFLNDRFLLLAGGVGTMLVSRDGAQTLTAVQSGTRLSLSAVATRDDEAFLVGQGGVHRACPFGTEP